MDQDIFDVRAVKKDARKAAFEARKRAHQSIPQETEDTPATALLLRYFRALAGVETIAGYMPIRTEIDPLPAMRVLHKQGYRICVPIVQGAGLPLSFAEWTPETEMVEGAFGALVPADPHPCTPDAVIAPLLAFDKAGYRLGYGGGFYDRTLEALGRSQRVYAYGFAYAAQEVPEVPREATDHRLDGIITEIGAF